MWSKQQCIEKRARLALVMVLSAREGADFTYLTNAAKLFRATRTTDQGLAARRWGHR